MGLFDEIFSKWDNTDATNAGEVLYYGMKGEFVNAIFKGKQRTKEGEIEAILFFSQAVRVMLYNLYPNTSERVLKEFTDAMIKELLEKGIESLVVNPTDFVNRRCEFYSLEWVKHINLAKAQSNGERLEEYYRPSLIMEYLYHQPLFDSDSEKIRLHITESGMQTSGHLNMLMAMSIKTLGNELETLHQKYKVI